MRLYTTDPTVAALGATGRRVIGPLIRSGLYAWKFRQGAWKAIRI